MDYLWIPNANYGPRAQGVASLFTGNGSSVGVDNIDPSNAPYNGRWDQWVPFSTTLKQIAIHMTAAPGAGKTESFQIHKGDGTTLGTLMQATGAAQVDITATQNITLPPADNTNDTTLLNTRLYCTGWVTASPNNVGQGVAAMSYSCAGQPNFQFFICSSTNTLNGATFAGTSAYANINDTIIDSTLTDQSNRQFRIPIAGKFKFPYAVYRGYLNTSTVVATFQKGTRGGAVDTVHSVTLTGHPSSTALLQGTGVEVLNEVNVVPGDYVNWRIQRTAGAATTGFITLGIAFSATTTAAC